MGYEDEQEADLDKIIDFGVAIEKLAQRYLQNDEFRVLLLTYAREYSDLTISSAKRQGITKIYSLIKADTKEWDEITVRKAVFATLNCLTAQASLTERRSIEIASILLSNYNSLKFIISIISSK